MAFISRIKRLFRHDGRKPTILSIKDMMSMSDEELGREFSKCGEWKHVLKKDSIENVINSIVWYALTAGVLSLITLLVGWFMTIFFSVSRLLFIGSGSILALSLIITGLSIHIDRNSSEYAEKKYDKHYEFNVLSPNGYLSGVFESFVKSLRVEGLTFNGPLYRYLKNIYKAVNRYHGYQDNDSSEIYHNHDEKYDYQYSYEDIGRMLKLMLPVAYLKQRTNFSEKSFNELDNQLGLTNKVIAFNEDIEQRRKDQAKYERMEQEQETHAAISDFISLGKESEQMKASPDYARIEDAAKRLNESKDSLVRTIDKEHTETMENGQ